MRFHNVRIYRVNFGNFKKGAALTIPRIGIFVGKGMENDLNLLRHEFGHILQFRKWGFWFFWRHIAKTSLDSAHASRKSHRKHQHTWTEWSANRLSYNYFNCPDDWNFRRFPIHPDTEDHYSKPEFARNNDEFISGWLEA